LKVNYKLLAVIPITAVLLAACSGSTDSASSEAVMVDNSDNGSSIIAGAETLAGYTLCHLRIFYQSQTEL